MPAPRTLSAALRKAALSVAAGMLAAVATTTTLHALAHEGRLGAVVAVGDGHPRHDTAGSRADAAARSRGDAAARSRGDAAARLDRRYGCSRTGLEPGTIPAHAVVRVGGEVRLTSFDEGWAIYEGRRPGTLVSVCAR